MSDAPVEQLPAYVIEDARSGRSKCKTCGRAIALGTLRIGMLIEGPYGTGYMWHHLRCAAQRQFERVEEAYEEEAWRVAKNPPGKVPSLDELRSLQEKAEQRRKERRALPYAERAPSGRSTCQHCHEPIDKDSLRIVLGRDATFGRQVRTRPINVHPSCVAAELMAEDCGTERSGFAEALRANSKIDTAEVEAALSQIGKLPPADER
ncbi:MAG: PARP-type zinc finger-containing protein [Candidatus Tectomicrobia bacterium]|nr:PARP-type zinc finger-containing protein [Candidatus Tectomicrobia bacterium]